METPRLNLPLIAAGQSQKHVTVNEALLKLDALATLTVQSASTVTPPPVPVDGQCWIVPLSASGTWAGRTGQIAVWRDGAWEFLIQRAGYRAHVDDRGDELVCDGTNWTAPNLRPAMVGINAVPDAVNRLSVASGAVLFSHAGSDMRATLNKAATGNTASLMFQSAFSGRAEIGLAGNDALSVKISADGIAWKTALSAEPGGQIRLPNQPFASARGLSLVAAYGASKLIYPTVGTNTGFYNGVTGVFTAPVAGLYAFNLSALTQLRATTYEIYAFQAGVNVGRVAYLDALPAAQFRQISGQVVLTLVAGETVEFVTTRPAADWLPLAEYTNSLIGRMVT